MTVADVGLRLQGKEPRQDVAEGRRVAAETLRALPAILEAVWSAAMMPAQERRRVMFGLWDQCVESGPPEAVKATARVYSLVPS